VKVRASLVLAVPAALLLWAFGVPFPVLWGVLTFFANFIPYLGSIVACSLPLAIAFLQLELGWQPLAVAGLLIALHLLSAYLVEPAMTGKAVGLSPLVLLAALAFWGQCWGLIGMLLAVPLTVMLKIVLENMAFTRPLAKLMGDD
jgi:predicted PurR-regulated permease PerM